MTMLRFWLPKILVVALVGFVGAIAFFYWPHSLPTVAATSLQPTGPELVAKGKYLTTAADCEACHTVPGGKPFTGGLPFKLPFGTLYSPNITPDNETGLGGWSDAEFVRAMRSGVGRHGEDLYPAFPYTSYALLSTDDTLAIKAYLDTLTPISSRAPPNELLFPFNQRNLMRGWKLLFVPRNQFAADPGKSDQLNRGEYLVEALAHCGECHTPRGLMFQRKQASSLAGAVVDGWVAWNVTPDLATGIGEWSDEQLSAYLSNGFAEGRGPAGGPMRQVIDLSLSRLPKSDIDAIVAYLRAVPQKRSEYSDAGRPNEPVLATASNPWSPSNHSGGLGEKIFQGACASCHGWDGKGQNSRRAALLGSHSVSDATGTNLIRVILQGSTDSAGTPTSIMPAFAAAYSDAEIAALSNYVIEHFGGRRAAVTPDDVEKAR